MNDINLNHPVNMIKKLQSNHGKVDIVVLTGSGISKGSGIPTFRGEDGLWRNYNAMDLATPQAFSKNPKLVWEWYSWRMGVILEKEPNPAHYSIVKLEKNKLLKWVITQNVDSLHFRAGSKNIIEVHGNIFRAKCESCKNKVMISLPPKNPPLCECGNMLRPDVVWFGEALDQDKINQAYKIVAENCDVLLVIGTSGLVYPIADLPRFAKLNNVKVIEFNINKTPISQFADYTIVGKSEITLPVFTNELLKTK